MTSELVFMKTECTKASNRRKFVCHVRTTKGRRNCLQSWTKNEQQEPFSVEAKSLLFIFQQQQQMLLRISIQQIAKQKAFFSNTVWKLYLWHATTFNMDPENSFKFPSFLGNWQNCKEAKTFHFNLFRFTYQRLLIFSIETDSKEFPSTLHWSQINFFYWSFVDRLECFVSASSHHFSSIYQQEKFEALRFFSLLCHRPLNQQ